MNTLFKVLSWMFAAVVVAAGIVNLFWGNDPGFGAFLVLLSLVYVPPLRNKLTKILGRPIPGWILLLLGIGIAWATLGVAELFDKIDLMLADGMWSK